MVREEEKNRFSLHQCFVSTLAKLGRKWGRELLPGGKNREGEKKLRDCLIILTCRFYHH